MGQFMWSLRSNKLRTLTLSISAFAFLALAGPIGTAWAAKETTPPGATLGVSNNRTQSSSFLVSATFSEPVTGFTAADLSNTGTATGCAFAVAPPITSTYTEAIIVVSGCSDGTVIIKLAAKSVTDVAGNLGPTAAIQSSAVIIDRTAPTASWTTVPTTPNNTSAVTGLSYTLAFNESVTGFTAADLSNTGTATGCVFVVGTPTGNAYPVTVTGCSEGTVIAGLWTGNIKDLTGNSGGDVVLASTVIINRTFAPVVSWSNPSKTYTNTNPSYVLSFSKPVTGIAASDFLNTGTAKGCILTPSASSGTAITVTTSGCTEGTITLKLLAWGVVDSVGNTGPSTETTSKNSYIDRTAPTAAWGALPSSPSKDASLVFKLSFSENVLGLNSADFTNAGKAKTCTFVPAALDYAGNFTLTATGCGDGTVIPKLAANGVNDIAGNTGPSAALQTTSAVIVDRTGPSVTSFNCSSSLSQCTITFSEPVTGFENGDLSYIGTSANWSLGALSGSTTGQSYTAAINGLTSSNHTSGTVQWQIAAGSATDLVGNTGPSAVAKSLGFSWAKK